MKKAAVRVKPFMQETRQFYRCGVEIRARGITALCDAGDGCLWVGTDHGLGVFDAGKGSPVDEEGAPRDVTVLGIRRGRGGRLWVGTVYGLYLRQRGNWQRFAPDEGVFWKRESVTGRVPSVVVPATAESDRAAYVATVRDLCRYEDGAFVVESTPRGLEIRDVAVDAKGRVWLATDKGAWLREGKRWKQFSSHGRGSVLESDDVRAIGVSKAGDVWIGTRRGISVRSANGKWRRVTGEEGLPFENVTCLALSPYGGEVWVGTTMGACRFDGKRWHYYYGQRWLPGDVVTCILPGRDETWIGGPWGLVCVRRVEMTLARKAELFEDVTRKRHNRMGWIASSVLGRAGDLSSSRMRDTDNDGLWTGLYVAAESFRYAVTGEAVARRRAKESFHAMLRLEEMSDIDGFPTKAIIPESQALNAGPIWNLCKKFPGWAWKGDCSSDEIDGHMFAYAVYYDLAADRREKVLLREIVRKIMDHIIDNGYILRYLDGNPTRWGVWGPQYLNTPAWAEQRGLNSLEILSHLKVAHHVTGDKRYEREYLRLAREENYAEYTVDQKIVTPSNCINHSDDELATLSYYPLLVYERDPELKALYVESIERTYKVLRPEKSPFHGFVYTACTGRDCGMRDCVQHLVEVPLDLVRWSVRNSHRSDVSLDISCGRFGGAQGADVLPPGERDCAKWNSNPYSLDAGSGGHAEEDGAFYLLPYWMGRYYGFIRET